MGNAAKPAAYPGDQKGHDHTTIRSAPSGIEPNKSSNGPSLTIIDASQELCFVARSEQMLPDSSFLVSVYGYKAYYAVPPQAGVG